MRIPHTIASGLLAALLSCSSMAMADWAVLNHEGTSITVAAAECLVSPSKPGNRLHIKRVRITRGGTSDVTHRFSYMISDDGAGDTQDLSTCSLPLCSHILTVEGIVEGQVYNADGLDLQLPPGARFYVHEDSHVAGKYVTIEVFYDEK